MFINQNNVKIVDYLFKLNLLIVTIAISQRLLRLSLFLPGGYIHIYRYILAS